MTSARSAPVVFTSLGAVALALGLLVYAIDRTPGRALLIPHLELGLASPLFGALGAWLPSAVHPFAFSLFTASLRPAAADPGYRACAAWWVVDTLAEVAQHPAIAPALVDTLGALAAGSALGRPVEAYLLRGRFDAGDLAAVTVGALGAALVLRVAAARGRHGR